MGTNKENGIVEIFAGSIMEAEIVKSLLEDSRIKAFLKDEFMGALTPWQVSAGGTGSVKVVLSNMDYDEGKLIIEEYRKNSNSIK